MKRSNVEQILIELGYTTKNELSEIDLDNDSEYIIWYNIKNKPEIYLGNWFIESEKKDVSFPYKENNSTKEKLIQYINNRL
jgi:hypothetical protein